MTLRYRKLIVDLDGTLCQGDIPLSGAVEALASLRQSCSFLFLSNNPIESAAKLARRLQMQGFGVHAEEVVSSVTLMIRALNELGSGLRVLSIASGDFEQDAEEAGHRLVTEGRKAEVVAVGVVYQLNYSKLSQALVALQSGASLIAANEDATYPAKEGLRPAAGAFLGIFHAMGFSPTKLCGKPDRWAMKEALSLRGFQPDSKCLVVGDRLDSDVLGANNLGIDSALVLTGVSSRADVEQCEIKPTFVLNAFAELPSLMGFSLASEKKRLLKSVDEAP